MQGVCAGLSNNADLGARPLAVLGRIGVGEYVEFANGIDAKKSPLTPPGVMPNWLEPVYSMPLNKTRFSVVRRPATEKVLPLLVLVWALFSAL